VSRSPSHYKWPSSIDLVSVDMLEDILLSQSRLAGKNLFGCGVASMVSDLALWLLSVLFHRLIFRFPSSSSPDLLSSLLDLTLRPSEQPNMAERKKYKHNPFSDQDSIRLLQLQSGAFDDDIRITLIEAPLSKPPKYEALSYVWGSRTPDTAISCHGLDLLVTENCALAMRRLRRRFKTRLLWIDAICIDQTSGEEKQHQVQLMGDVFSKAEEVIIWLGEKCTYSNFAMSLLSNYSAITTSIWRKPIRGILLDQQMRKLRGK